MENEKNDDEKVDNKICRVKVRGMSKRTPNDPIENEFWPPFTMRRDHNAQGKHDPHTREKETHELKRKKNDDDTHLSTRRGRIRLLLTSLPYFVIVGRIEIAAKFFFICEFFFPD